MRKKALKLDHVKRFVLDECDKLLEQLGASPSSLRAAALADRVWVWGRGCVNPG